MSTNPPHLTTSAVKALLTRDTVGSIDELHQFGSMLLTECLDRAKQIDTKATALAGYTGVILAILVSALSGRLTTLPATVLWPLLAGSFCVIIGGGLAIAAVRVQRYDWFSDRDWFAPEVIAEPARLRQAHLLALHAYKTRHEVVNARRAKLLRWAYGVLGVGSMLLVAAIAAPIFLPAT